MLIARVIMQQIAGRPYILSPCWAVLSGMLFCRARILALLQPGAVEVLILILLSAPALRCFASSGYFLFSLCHIELLLWCILLLVLPEIPAGLSCLEFAVPVAELGCGQGLPTAGACISSQPSVMWCEVHQVIC
jgi:hypothetical protein